MVAHQDIFAKSAQILDCLPHGNIGVAVSGGGDSVALLHIIKQWAEIKKLTVSAATVNHNLRPEALDEAKFVSKICVRLGIEHSVLNWDGWNGQGNLQNAAREARKSLLAKWAASKNIPTIVLGHTQDDQAETFLMRLARGSGVDGLSAMNTNVCAKPVFVRPLLDVSRNDLRTYLEDIGQDWVDDPTNEDETYDRIKMRKAMPILAELGLTSERLSMTAAHMSRARGALEHFTLLTARTTCQPNLYGTVQVDLHSLGDAPKEIQLRVIAHAICWVSRKPYRPRLSALEDVYSNLMNGISQTLSGCYLQTLPNGRIDIMRELANMDQASSSDKTYDRRWNVQAKKQDLSAAIIMPLGTDGIAQIDNWRDFKVSRDVLLQLPAAWHEGQVICVACGIFDGPVELSLKADVNEFFLDIVSH